MSSLNKPCYDDLSMQYTTRLTRCSPAACYDNWVYIHHTKWSSHEQTQTNTFFQDLKFKSTLSCILLHERCYINKVVLLLLLLLLLRSANKQGLVALSPCGYKSQAKHFAFCPALVVERVAHTLLRHHFHHSKSSWRQLLVNLNFAPYKALMTYKTKHIQYQSKVWTHL